MNINQRKILFFGIQFCLFFLVCLLLYPKILPGYQEIVFYMVEPLLQYLTPNKYIHIVTDAKVGWRIDVFEPEIGKKWFFGIDNQQLSMIYMNLVLVPAIFLATPVGIKKRLHLFCRGVSLLLIVHVLSVTAFVYVWSTFYPIPEKHQLCQHIIALFSPGGQVFAVVIWCSLTWKHWFPKSGISIHAKEVNKIGRNALCSCDSGLKYKRCCGSTV